MTPVAKAAFEKLQSEYLCLQEWTDIDLLTIIGYFAKADPVIAHAFSLHAADILAAAHDEDIEYADLVAEMYRRTFFDPEHAGKYGTAHIAGVDEVVTNFVDFIITQYTVERSNSKNVIAFAPPLRM